MANDTAKTQTINIVPVQGIFEPEPTFAPISLIGPAGTPFFAPVNPLQSGLNITNSTINSTTIGATSPSTAAFTSATVSSSPVGGTDVANKTYVDYIAAGLTWKTAVLTATTANITLSGLQTIDGISVASGDRVLVKDQTTASQNGIYIASAGAWSRSTDADTWNELVGAVTFVESGSTTTGSAWYCSAQPGGTLGTTAINWSALSVGAMYSAGAGLTLAGYQFSLTPVGSATTYGSASQVPVFTTNAYGQIASVTNTNIAINANQITSGTIDTARISGSYTGITGVGTLTAGTWNAGTIGVGYGGSGAATFTAGYLKASGTNPFSTVSTIPSSDITGLGSMATQNANAVAITGGTISGLSPPLEVSSGGTGAATLTGYVFGNGTGAFTASTTIPNTAITGLGTMSTQNANSVAITGGTMSGVAITGGTISGLSSPLAVLDGGTGVTTKTGTGSVVLSTSPTLVTPDLGTPTSLTLTNATGLPLTTGVTGTLPIANGGTNSTATPTAGGISYGTGTAFAFTAAGTSGQFLQSNGSGAPTWATPVSYASVTDDTTTNTTYYPLLADQTTGNLTTEYVSSTKLRYNPSTGVLSSTSFTGAGTGLTGTASGLSIGGNAATATSATTATNLAGGTGNQVPYQTGAGATSFVTAPTVNGSALTYNGTSLVWSTPAASLTITDDTTTNATRYLTFTSATTGSISSENVSSSKLQFNPSTGALTSTSLTPTNALGATYGGTGLTSAGTAGNVLTSNGSAWVSQSPAPTVQTYNTGTGATWTKPSTANWVKIELWGGGGSGGKGASNGPAGGGGGGAYNTLIIPFADLASSTITYTVGAGGAAQTSASTVGNAGGNSSVQITNLYGATRTLYAYGGGAGGYNSTGGNGAGGGGIYSAGGNGGTSGSPPGATGGSPVGGAGGNNSTPSDAIGSNFGGGGGGGGGTGTAGTYQAGGVSVYGGGGGGAGQDGAGSNTNPGGNSLYGGGGGGGASNSATPGSGGTSVYGGNGSAGAIDANTSSDGSAPGGGSGGTEGGNSGAGGAGRVQFTYW